MKNPKFAIAPEGCASYLTPGKKYEISNFNGDSFETTSNSGGHLYTLIIGSAHLNGKNWILC